MERDTEDYIMQLEKRLVLLEGRVAMLEARLAGVTPVPTRHVSPTLQQNCPVCGITFIDSLGRPITLGYACNRNGCPSGVSYSTKLEPHLNTTNITAYNPMNRGNLDL
jgi:hypothetical protein